MTRWLIGASAVMLAACSPAPPADSAAAGAPAPVGPTRVRVALFNIWELSSAKILDVDARGVGVDPQARAAATIIQHIRPDVLVINEIDHDYDSPDGDLALNARRFASAYLATGEAPLTFEHAWAAPNNTGILSGVDLDGNGHVATVDDVGDRQHGDDSFGFGLYPGQYSIAVLSRFAVDEAAVRSFREFLWTDLPGNHIPEGFYSEQALAVFRLSSKSHQDVPLRIGEGRLHLLLSHPTPIVFDGDEDRNGRRNFDEIKLWADYLRGGEGLRDDQGNSGGYGAADPFVVIGDLNARPGVAESVYDGRSAISQLLEHPRVRDTAEVAISPGAPDGVPTATTAFRGQGARIDYVLPSLDLQVLDGGVFWPDVAVDPAGAALATEASDHRLVWIDVAWPPSGD